MKVTARLRDLMSPARRKIRLMTAHDMLRWADDAGGRMRQSLASYAQSGSLVDLAEYEQGVAVLAAFAEELRARHRN